MKYQVCTLHNDTWIYGAIYDTLEAAKWHIDHVTVDPIAIVVDITTGEVVYGM